MKYYNNKKYLNVNEWVKKLNQLYGKYGIKVEGRDVHQLFHHYGLKPIKTNTKREKNANSIITWFSESSFLTVCYRDDFLQVLYNITTFGDARGQENVYTPINNNKEQLTYKNDENDMEKHSQYLEKVYQMENNIKNMKKKIVISESAFKRLFENTFNEDVFVNSIKNKNGKNVAMLRYNKKNKSDLDNLNYNDMLSTSKMDKESNDTYEVPLKGGIMSYNITSINGTEVMHYFKNYFDNSKETTIKINNEKYKLDFEKKNEFNDFMQTFINKIDSVISYVVSQRNLNMEEMNINKIALYPIHSSSRFNIEMVKKIHQTKSLIFGLPTEVIDDRLLQKNTNNLEVDDEFIQQNQEYYNSQRFTKSRTIDKNLKTTHMNGVQTDMNRLHRYADIQKQIDRCNYYTASSRGCTGLIIRDYYKINEYLSRNQEPPMELLKKLKDNILLYYQEYNKIYDVTEYYKEGLGTIGHQDIASVARPKRYSKSRYIQLRTEKIIELLNHYNLGKGLKLNIPICEWEMIDFQIKSLNNDSRMALKNYFQFFDDEELVKKEMVKIQNSILVIFDDNVSGGATLSDVCYQLMQKGVDKKLIIPITFGKMGVSWGTQFDTVAKTKFNLGFSDDDMKQKNQKIVNAEKIDNGQIMLKKISKGEDFFNNGNKPIKILWLDDERNPYLYLPFKQKTNNWRRVNNIYKNYIYPNYSPSFDWVHNANEFKRYIMTNGLPDIISFDRDLKKNQSEGIKNGKYEAGEQCAKWLVDYCQKNHLKMPLCIIHSANSKNRPIILSILQQGNANVLGTEFI